MTFRPLSPELQRIHERYQMDLSFFCRKCLRVKLKIGGDAPFIWNKAQQYLHDKIEDQLQRTGKVRVIVLKGRQQGVSTYIASRFYHKATRQRGRRVFILSHHSSTTGTLFQIVDKYHKACPDAAKPKETLNNNRQMVFENQSQYTVGTAGTGDIDRGNTNQYLHWSEVGFSENIDSLLTGVFQTVADVDGTEKILESTANGVGNYFHTACLDAMAGESEYELVFIPWFWQDEYTATPREDFVLSSEELGLKQMHGLTNGQLQWRRNKIGELKAAGHGVRKFKQEYPCSVKEAFQSSGDPLYDPDAVARARKSHLTDKHAPIVLGVDPGPITDRTTIAWRQGRHLLKIEKFFGLSQMGLVGKLAQRIDRYPDIAKVFMDVAEGRGAVDRLDELGYGDIVKGIAFAMSPTDDELYVNKRAEMAGLFKEWIEDELGVRIPDTAGTESLASGDEIEVEIGVIPNWKPHSLNKRQLVPKDDIKKTYGKSPDLVDAIFLTFAQPVRNSYTQNRRVRKIDKRSQSELSVINRRRGARPNESPYDDDFEGGGGIHRIGSRFKRPR